MINREVYLKDPSSRKLVNEGVAKVNDDKNVLRYELETFVCEGQYEEGLNSILHTYLTNLGNKEVHQQPGVWVSGFFGSGKSHLVKMLAALWEDTEFSDGATARGVVVLPKSITDNLRELSTQAKRHGGLHAASGALSAGADGSVRLSLLRIVFKSAGLPEHYHLARFVMWLKQKGVFDEVRAVVEEQGNNWDEELANFYVAEDLHRALVAVKPELFKTTQECVKTLNNRYPFRHDVSSDDMIDAIRAAISQQDSFPLTLIALDEVQQYIGADEKRSEEMREVVESCCKEFEKKLLFVGTGQTAITGTSNLKKHEGRFTIRVGLYDADVDAVVRKVVLAKKPEAKEPIAKMMEENIGEISRHLAGTSIGHRREDVAVFPMDYPLLPVRRRFWEETLRVLDETGTDSQLRNQLHMVHSAIQSNLDDPVGKVIPADFIYFKLIENLTSRLPREVYEKTRLWNRNGNDDEVLTSRAVGLVFLINRLAGSREKIGVRATVDTIADLMVEDLRTGSSDLRKRLPALLDACDLLMKVDDEYRIQTKESTVWNGEFNSQKSVLANEAHRIEAERDDRIRRHFADVVGKLSLLHGESKVSRDLHPIFDVDLPTGAEKQITVWVRSGWVTDDASVQADARQAGNESPVIFVYIPNRSATDLRDNLIEFKAASATLDRQGVPNSPEGQEARASIETKKKNAEARIGELLTDLFSGARLFQGGGKKIVGNGLQAMITEAAENALSRLYPQFPIADHHGWAKVYDRARKGSPDGLKGVGYDGEPAGNPVCKGVLGFIAAGKSGTDLRAHFEGPPFGWSRDAVDGALLVLLQAGLIRALDDRGNAIDVRDLERKSIGKASFRVESTTVTAAQRIGVRKVMQKLGITATGGEELAAVPKFLDVMKDLAESAGGEAPKPEQPDRTLLDDIRRAGGNEQLMAIYNGREELASMIEEWTERAERIGERIGSWRELHQLSRHADGLRDAEILRAQVTAIEEGRQLLDDPDPVPPLLANITQLLRAELNRLKEEWEQKWNEGEGSLAGNEYWEGLDPEERHRIRSEHQLTGGSIPEIDVRSSEGMLQTLNAISLHGLRDRIAAMPGRFAAVLVGAARMREPEVREVALPTRTLRTEEELTDWLQEVESSLREALTEGPIIV